MKKIIKIVFSLLLVFILFGCEKNKKKIDDNKLGISYTVGFNYEDDNNNPVRLEKKFSHGEILGGVDIGGKKGHDLIGWYLNNQLFYFGKEVVRNLELYAKYTKKIYKVELNPQNGENVHNYNVEYNTKLFPTIPTKDNHIFLGWYKGDKLYDLDKPITENLSLVAKWAKEKHLVRINFKKDKLGNDVYKEVYVTHGETLKADDFIFDGKRYEIGSVNPDDKSKVVVNYFDETNNTIFDLNTKITDDKLVLKPIYDDVYLTYVLNILGKKVEKNVRYGSSILHKQSDFEEVFNKYFDGVKDDSNNLIDENYKLTESGKEFYVKYYNGVPDEGFLYTLNDTKTGYILDRIKRDYAGDVEIPKTYKGLPVVGISEGAFMNFRKIRNVRLNDYIERIPEFAFYNCTNLENIEADFSKLKEIGRFAFRDCINLKGFEFEKTNLTEIGDSAFYNCKSLEKVLFPATLQTVHDMAFKDCENVTKLDLSKITYLGSSAFYNCKKIEKVIIPKTLESIEDSTFYNLENLSELSLGDSVKKIGNYAFKNTPNLVNFHIPSSVRELGRFVFSQNSNIKVLNLLNVKGLLQDTFDNFSSLEEIRFYDLEFLYNNFIKRAPKLNKIVVNNYNIKNTNFGDFKNIDLHIQNKISVSKINFAFRSIKMDKNCEVDTTDKILEFKNFKNLETKIYLSDDVKGIKNYIDPTRISYIYAGKNFTDLEKLFFAKRDHSDKFDFDVSSENKLVKEFDDQRYLLKGDNYYLYYLKDYSITKINLISKVSPDIKLPLNKLNITEIALNKVDSNFNFDSEFFNDYHKIERVVLYNNANSRFKEKNNMIYESDEKTIAYIPHGVNIDTFNILKDQVSPNFLYHPSIKNFTIEAGNTIYEIDNANKFILYKDNAKKYIARYFGDSDTTEINSYDGLLKSAFNNKNLKKIIFNINNLNAKDDKVYLGDNVNNLVFKKSLNANTNQVEFNYFSKFQTNLKVSFQDDAKFVNAIFPENLNLVENSNLIEKIAQRQFKNTKIKEFDFSNVSEVQREAFKNCSELEKLENLKKDAYVLEDAFYNCDKLKTVYIGKNTDKRAYFMSDNIEEITLDNKEIHFNYISSLKISKVEIKDSVEKIYHFADSKYKLNKNLQHMLSLSSNIREVQNLHIIFPNLEKLTINSKLDSTISYDKFLNLREVIFGDDAEILEKDLDDSFSYLKKIPKVSVSQNNQKFKIVDKFVLSNNMKKLYRYVGDETDNLTIPSDVLEISEGFSNNLSNLTSITFTGKNYLNPDYIPNKVSTITIKSNDFSISGYANTKIKKVYIASIITPENIEKIGAEMANVDLIEPLDNTDYILKDGIFYTSDYKKLIAYPKYLKHKILKVDRRVREITANFNGNLHLEEIYLPKELEKFTGTLKNCFNLVIYYEKGCMNCKNFDVKVFNPTFLKMVFDKEFDY